MKRTSVAVFAFALTLATAGASVGAQHADLGTLEFENSGSEAAQDVFIRGVLLLHSFEYEDARSPDVATTRCCGWNTVSCSRAASTWRMTP